MNETMVKHFTSDRGLAVGQNPVGCLDSSSNLMCRKSLKNNDLPPPPPENSPLAPSTKRSTSQHRPPDRARLLGVAPVWPRGPKLHTAGRPSSVRRVRRLGPIQSTALGRARPRHSHSSSRYDPPLAFQRSRTSCPRRRRDALQPGFIENSRKGVRKVGVVYSALLLTAIQRSKKCPF